MTDYFAEVTDIETLRKRYRELLKKLHPDNGGNVSDMQELNKQYDSLFERLSHEKRMDGQPYTYDETAGNEAFKEVLNNIIHINADIEIIGSWIWIHGGYGYRELLKSVGFKFAPKKKCWCWHFGEYKLYHKSEVNLIDIRLKYGSQMVNYKSKQFVLNKERKRGVYV